MPPERLTLRDGSTVDSVRADGVRLLCAFPHGVRAVQSWEARDPGEWQAVWRRLGGGFGGLSWEDGTPAKDDPPLL